MKVTQLRVKDKSTALTTMEIETWIEKTRTETKAQPVSAFREVLRYSLPDSRCYEADKLPKILPAAEFRRTEGGIQMKSYNGIVELTVGPLAGSSEIALVKQLAWEQPQTYCAFTGSSKRSVKIWVKFTRPDNSLPQKREEAEIFHAHAYRLAVKCYNHKFHSISYRKNLRWNNIHDYHTIQNSCTGRMPYRFICHSPWECPRNYLIGKPYIRKSRH